jgi:hypothetical protein
LPAIVVVYPALIWLATALLTLAAACVLAVDGAVGAPADFGGLGVVELKLLVALGRPAETPLIRIIPCSENENKRLHPGDSADSSKSLGRIVEASQSPSLIYRHPMCRASSRALDDSFPRDRMS